MYLSWECDAGASLYHAGSDVGLRGEIIPDHTLDICMYCERVIVWTKLNNDGTDDMYDWLNFEGQLVIQEWP